MQAAMDRLERLVTRRRAVSLAAACAPSTVFKP
jgi:hypothetical protein